MVTFFDETFVGPFALDPQDYWYGDTVWPWFFWYEYGDVPIININLGVFNETAYTTEYSSQELTAILASEVGQTSFRTPTDSPFFVSVDVEALEPVGKDEWLDFSFGLRERNDGMTAGINVVYDDYYGLSVTGAGDSQGSFEYRDADFRLTEGVHTYTIGRNAQGTIDFYVDGQLVFTDTNGDLFLFNESHPWFVLKPFAKSKLSRFQITSGVPSGLPPTPTDSRFWRNFARTAET